MGKTNKKTNKRLGRISALFIAIAMAVALGITGALCFGINRKTTVGNNVGSVEESAVTTWTMKNKINASDRSYDFRTDALNGVLKVGDILNFDYLATTNYTGVNTSTNGDYKITLPAGEYKLETWGAQGGDARNNDGTSRDCGGLGGYTSVIYKVEEEVTLYVVVGGSGQSFAYNQRKTLGGGGYNGGGDQIQSGTNGGGGGGGATHIAIDNGVRRGELLNYYQQYIITASPYSGNITAPTPVTCPGDFRREVILVAGGGGGGGHDLSGSTYGKGGPTENHWNGFSGGGGGLKGNDALHGGSWGSCRWGLGATQSAGGGLSAGTENSNGNGAANHQPGVSNTPGIFGKGGRAIGSSNGGGGGGGGWYGGSGGHISHGGGGSGHIAGIKDNGSFDASFSLIKGSISQNSGDYSLLTASAPQGYPDIPSGYKTQCAAPNIPNSNYTGSYKSADGKLINGQWGNGYARITVNQLNVHPIATPPDGLTDLEKKSASSAYNVTSFASDNDASGYGKQKTDVYFCNSLTDHKSDALKAYLNEECTIPADDYIDYTLTNKSFKLNFTKKLPRASTYEAGGVTKDLTWNNKLRVYFAVRDDYKPAKLEECGVVSSYLELSYKTLDITHVENNSDATPAGIGVKRTVNGVDYIYRYGTSTTADPGTLTYETDSGSVYANLKDGKVYSLTHGAGAKFALTIDQPIRKGDSIKISAEDALGNLMQGATYDKDRYMALIVPDTTSPTAAEYTYELPAPTAFYPQSNVSPTDTNALSGYTYVSVKGIKSKDEWFNPSWTLYLVEKVSVGKNNREPVGIKYDGNSAPLSVEVNFRVDNIRPTLNTSQNNVIDVAVGEYKEITLSALGTTYLTDGDHLSQSGLFTNANYSIADVILPEYEFTMVDKYGHIQNLTAMVGASTGKSFYNVFDPATTNIADSDVFTTGTNLTETGFDSEIVFDATENASGTYADSFLYLEHDSTKIILRGLRASYSMYKPERTAYATYTGGTQDSGIDAGANTAENPGHFYLLVNIIDNSEPTDEGVWIPLAITVGNAANGVKPVSTGDSTHAYSNQTVMTTTASAVGAINQTFMFTPMGINTTSGSFPIGYYEEDGELKNDGLQALSIDADNFATDDGLSVWGGTLNEFVSLAVGTDSKSDLAKAATVAEKTANTVATAYSKYVKVEPLKLYVPVSYFGKYADGTSDNTVKSRLAAIVNGDTTFGLSSDPSLTPAGVKKLNFGNVSDHDGATYTLDGESVDCLVFYGLKITLVSSTMNRYLYADVELADSTSRGITAKIAIKANNTSPNAVANAVHEDEDDEDSPVTGYKNVAQGVLSETSSVEYDGTASVPTIRYRVPVNTAFMITPYDLVFDYDIQKQAWVSPIEKGFTLNYLSGAVQNGTFTAGGSFVPSSGDTATAELSGAGANVNAIYSSGDYAGAAYKQSTAAMLRAIAAKTNVKSVSKSAENGDSYDTLKAEKHDDDTDDTTSISHDKDILNDRLYFVRSDDNATDDDGNPIPSDPFLFDPYAAETRTNNFVRTGDSFNSYIRAYYGSKINIPAGYDSTLSGEYNVDFVVIKTFTRAAQPITMTFNVRDRAGSSFVAVNVVVEVINSAPSLKRDSALNAAKISVATDTPLGEGFAATDVDVDVNNVMEDINGDRLIYVVGYGLMLANTPDLTVKDITKDGTVSFANADPDWLTDDNGNSLSAYYAQASFKSTEKLTVKALSSTQNVSGGLYVYFLVSDNRGGLTLGYKQVEVLNSRPVLNTAQDAFQSTAWTVESTGQSDITRSRYVAGSEDSKDLIKALNPSAVDADIRLLSRDVDALHASVGAALSPRVPGSDGGAYINLDKTKAFSDTYAINTAALKDALDYSVPAAGFPTSDSDILFADSTEKGATSGTTNVPYAVLLYKYENGVAKAGSPNMTAPTDGTSPQNAFVYNLYFKASDGSLKTGAAIIDEIVAAAALVSDETTYNNYKAILNNYFDDEGRWIVTDWALELKASKEMDAGVSLGVEISVRDLAVYGGDTAGMTTAKAPDRTAPNIDVVSAYKEGKNPFKFSLYISGTGIRVKDEFAAYNDYYVVEDPTDETGVRHYISPSGALYTGSNGSADFDGAFQYKSVIEIPSDKSDIYVPMSYFGTLQTLVSPLSGLVNYDTKYVGYNVSEKGLDKEENPNSITYDKGDADDVYAALSLYDGKYTWSGADGEYAIDKNPYIEIVPVDYTSDKSGATYFGVGASSAYYNTTLATAAVDKDGKAIYDNSKAAISTNLIASGKALKLVDQASNLIEHNFGLKFTKKQVRTGASNLTLTIKLAKSEGNHLQIGKITDSDGEEKYTVSQDSREVNVFISVANSDIDLDTSGNAAVKFDNGVNGGTYYADVTMSSSDTKTFKLARKGDSSEQSEAGSGITDIHYIDEDISLGTNASDKEYRDYAYFAEDSIASVGQPTSWQRDVDKSRPADAEVSVVDSSYVVSSFANTTDRQVLIGASTNVKMAQLSMKNYYNSGFPGVSAGVYDCSDAGHVLYKEGDPAVQQNLYRYNPNGGRYGYSGYFGVSASDGGRSLNIMANNKTVINSAAVKKIVGTADSHAGCEDIYTTQDTANAIRWNDDLGAGYTNDAKTYGGLTKAQLSAVAATRGMRVIFSTGSTDTNYTIERWYYPLRVLIYDDFGAGFNSASYVAMEFRITIVNTDPTLNPKAGEADGSDGARIYEMELAIDKSAEVNLYDIVDDRDMYVVGTRTKYLATAFEFFEDDNYSATGIMMETGDYLVSPYEYASEDVISEQGDTSKDVIMYMTTYDGDEKIPIHNVLKFTVNRRATNEDGSPKTQFIFPLKFRDAMGRETPTMKFVVNITNQMPTKLTSVTSVKLRVNQSFTLLTTYYDYFAPVIGLDDSGNKIYSAAYEKSQTKADWNNRGAKTSWNFADCTTDGARCGNNFIADSSNVKQNPEMVDGEYPPFDGNLGYIGVANDDTPWTLRIKNYSSSQYLSGKLSVSPGNTLKVEGRENGVDGSISTALTVRAVAACKDVPFSVTIIDGEGGTLTYTVRVTVISSSPVPVDGAAVGAGLVGSKDENGDLTGVYDMYLIYSKGENKVTRDVELNNGVTTTASNTYTVYMKDVAKDPDGDDETNKMTLFGGGQFTVNGVALTAEDESGILKSDYFNISFPRESNGKAFTVTSKGYNPNSAFETLMFYVADNGDITNFGAATPITIRVYTLYSDLVNTQVPAGNEDYRSYLSGSNVVHVKSIDSFKLSSSPVRNQPTKYAFVDLAGNVGTDGNTVKPIVDNDVGTDRTQYYKAQLYVFMKDSGTDKAALSVQELGGENGLLIRDDQKGTFRINPEKRLEAERYLVGGVEYNGVAIKAKNQSNLSYLSRYVKFTFSSDGTGIFFEPAETSTLDKDILLYIEVTKPFGGNRGVEIVNGVLSAGTLFKLDVINSAPRKTSSLPNGSEFSFVGRKGDSATFKIFDRADVYGSLFTDSDVDDYVTVEGFDPSDETDSDYRTALSGNGNLDWQAGNGKKVRAITVTVNPDNTLTVTINRRIDKKVGEAFADSVQFDLVITGTDTMNGTSTATISVTVCNSAPNAVDEFSMYDDESSIGYSIVRDSGNEYTANVGVKQGEDVLISLADFMRDADYTDVNSDTDSYRFVTGPESDRYDYVVDKSVTVNYDPRGDGVFKREIAVITPIGKDAFHRTGLRVSASSATRGYTGTALVRVVDRASDVDDTDRGIVITVNITIMNDAPFVLDGKKETRISLLGSSDAAAKQPEKASFGIEQFVGDPNTETDVVGPTSSVNPNTYLRIHSLRYLLADNLYSTAEIEQTSDGNDKNIPLVASDSSALFKLTIEGDYNQQFFIQPVEGFFGVGSIEITVSDGENSIMSDSETVSFVIVVEVLYNPEEISGLNGISLARGKRADINIESLIPDIHNTMSDLKETVALKAAKSVAPRNASETFNPASSYMLLNVEPAEESVDYLTVTHDEAQNTWSLRASKVSVEPKRVNVKYALKAYPEVSYENYFEVTIGENYKPQALFNEITFIRYSDAVEADMFMLNNKNTAMLRPDQFLVDQEDDVMTLREVKSERSALVVASVVDDGKMLSLTFNARGSSEITIVVSDETDESAIVKIKVINNDLPEPSLWMRLSASFEANKVMWAIIIGLVILLIIILIIIIAVVRKRKREREELEALLVSEMEIEDQMYRLAGAPSPTGYQSFGYLQSAPGQTVDPGMLLGTGMNAPNNVPELALPPSDNSQGMQQDGDDQPTNPYDVL